MSEGDPNQGSVPPIPPQESEKTPPPLQPSFAEKFSTFANPPPIPFPGPVSPDERSWAVAINVSALIAHILGPLILWLIKRPASAYLDEVGKEAVNFQISFLIYDFAVGILTVATCGALWPLYFPLFIAWLVFVIIASVKYSSGEHYRYPLTIRLIP